MSEDNNNQPEPNKLAKFSENMNKISKGSDKVSKGSTEFGKGCMQTVFGLFLLIIIGFLFYSCH